MKRKSKINWLKENKNTKLAQYYEMLGNKLYYQWLKKEGKE